MILRRTRYQGFREDYIRRSFIILTNYYSVH
jgi:hypothetical protein